MFLLRSPKSAVFFWDVGVQSVNWQTPSFTVGARRSRSSMQTDLYSRRSEAIEEAQKRLYLHTHTSNYYIICLGLLRPTQSWNKDCSYRCSCTHAQDYAIPQIAWWAVTRRTTQTTETAKIGGGRLIGCGRLLGTLRYHYPLIHFFTTLLILSQFEERVDASLPTSYLPGSPTYPFTRWDMCTHIYWQASSALFLE